MAPLTDKRKQEIRTAITATRTKAATDVSAAEQRSELEEYLNIGVQAKVDRLMADIDARRGRK